MALYGTISSSYQSITLTMGNVVFIFLRWSEHFASLYTAQFLPNITYSVSTLPVLHLLPVDSSILSLNDTVLKYEQQLINSPVSVPFSDQVSLGENLNIYFFEIYTFILGYLCVK